MNANRSRKTLFGLLLALFAGPVVMAQTFTWSVDVPTPLDSIDYQANQTVLRDGGAYTLRFDGPLFALEPDVNIDALFQLAADGFLFSIDAPSEIDAIMYGAADVILFDGAGFSLFVSAADLRLPDDADIDALAVDPDGRLMLSFATPADVGTATYHPADIALVDGTQLQLLFDGLSTGLHPSSNVIGYDYDLSGNTFYLFDAPTNIGGLTFLPGQIARFDGQDWALWFEDTAFSTYSAATDFSFEESPGDAQQLMLGKLAPQGVQLDLNWASGCSASDYAIYRGTIGTWDSHQPVICSTAGASNASVPSAGAAEYYLVVPLGESVEGDYGRSSDGLFRPASLAACRVEQRIAMCL